MPFTVKKPAALLLVAVLLPLSGYCALLDGNGIYSIAKVINFLNWILLGTSLLSIKQYLLPGEVNKTVFHIGNIVFIVLFYLISLSFMSSNMEYYEMQGNGLLACLQSVFLSLEWGTVMQWIIVISLVFNILYIKKYSKDYYKG